MGVVRVPLCCHVIPCVLYRRAAHLPEHLTQIARTATPLTAPHGAPTSTSINALLQPSVQPAPATCARAGVRRTRAIASVAEFSACTYGLSGRLYGSSLGGSTRCIHTSAKPHAVRHGTTKQRAASDRCWIATQVVAHACRESLCP